MKLFYLGSNIHQEALNIIEAASNAMVVYEDIDIGTVGSSIEKLASADRAVSISKKHIIHAVNAGMISGIEEREHIVSAVLNDFRLFLLKTRFTRVDADGAFYSVAYFADVVEYALNFAAKYKPDLVYCSYTPHTVEAWIFMRTMEEAGIRILRLIASPLPWIALPVTGLSEGRIESLSSGHMGAAKEKIDKYFDLLSGTYEKALPYYERGMRFFSPQKIRAMFASWNPKNVAKSLEKYLVFKEYSKAARPFDTEAPFATYFLHYQPEMNTIPEAGLYCDQYQAIVKIALALPEGVKLIVKEHPSTFTKRCDRRWRPRGFYDRIARIPNTQICPPGADAFQHIDRAEFVASIAGVCLTEALARGVTAVTFYPCRFRHFSDGLVIDASSASQSELRQLLASRRSQKIKLSEVEVKASLVNVANNGYDGSTNETFIPRAVSEAAGNSRRANCIAIQDVIDGTLS